MKRLVVALTLMVALSVPAIASTEEVDLMAPFKGKIEPAPLAVQVKGAGTVRDHTDFYIAPKIGSSGTSSGKAIYGTLSPFGVNIEKATGKEPS
jgi:hypothetical protein